MLAGTCGNNVVFVNWREFPKLFPAMIDSRRYFKMTDVQKAIQQEFEIFQQYSLVNGVESRKFYQLLYRRLHGKPTLRAFFAVVIYDYLKAYGHKAKGVPDSFFYRQFPFILEVIISIQYYHNQILDRKYGVDNHLSIGNNLNAANLLRDQLADYIEGSVQDKTVKGVVSRHVRKIFQYVDIGQYMERRCNRYNNWSGYLDLHHSFSETVEAFIDQHCIDLALDAIEKKTGLSNGQNLFFRRYFERIYLTNAAMYKVTSLILLELLNARNPGVVHFSSLFGITKQVINDIADLIPSRKNPGTDSKRPKDAFADLRNCNVTLPLGFHLLAHPNGHIGKYLKNKGKMNWNEQLEETAFLECLQSHSVYQAIRTGKKLKRQAISCLDKSNPEYELLLDMAGVADWNKYYYVFMEDHKEYYSAYKRTG